MNVAIFNCKKSSDNCTGASCLKKFADCDGCHDQKIVSFFHCSGCDEIPGESESFNKKLDRLIEENIEKVFFSPCIKEGCPYIDDFISMFSKKDIKIERSMPKKSDSV